MESLTSPVAAATAEAPPAPDGPQAAARPRRSGPTVEVTGSPEANNREWVRWVRRVLALVVIVVGWQIGCSTGLIERHQMSSPATVVRTIWDMTRSGELPDAIGISLERAAKGFALGIVTGVVVAVIAGLWRAGEDLLDTPIQVLRTLPWLALIPLFIMWFGIGETPKILLIAIGVFFPIYLNVFAGIRNVDLRLVEAARTFGATRRQLIVDVVLPGAIPQFLVGLRLALSVSWLSLVIAETLNADSGIGYLMNRAREMLQTDVIVVCLVVYGALGLLFDVLVRLLERRSFRWRRGFTGN
ncbi:ABC transporter permease [Frankia tisae]|uniref:ABC transporter permease n=1 Tax=Frankia tisae TaxID=2950104 RepID=UPI0021BF7E60|nr:ABC transporter permease [Frankia tisae]